MGAFVSGTLEGSLLVVLVFSLDVFFGPAMTSGGGLLATLTPTRKAADTLTATQMAFRDQRRRPLLLLLVVVPAYVITRSIAITQAIPRRIGLPNDQVVITTMKDLHGAVMAGTAIAFVAALCSVFVMKSALEGDRRLVIAGFRPGETVLARLIVLAAGTILVVTVSMAVTAASFTPAACTPFIGSALLIGVIYAALGALAGALLAKLAATYPMLFLVMTDLGIAQNPMFGSGTPRWWAALLPGFGPGRMATQALALVPAARAAAHPAHHHPQHRAHHQHARDQEEEERASPGTVADEGDRDHGEGDAPPHHLLRMRRLVNLLLHLEFLNLGGVWFPYRV